MKTVAASLVFLVAWSSVCLAVYCTACLSAAGQIDVLYNRIGEINVEIYDREDTLREIEDERSIINAGLAVHFQTPESQRGSAWFMDFMIFAAALDDLDIAENFQNWAIEALEDEADAVNRQIRDLFWQRAECLVCN